jgi:hypothetical protein
MGTVVIATSEPAARTVALWLLAGFLGSFIFIRTSARLMRSPKVPWWPGSVTSGDLHIHHLVWGIILLLLCGFLGFATTPITPWTQILAVLFGIGAGFTLDEFALWLRLEDVYWAEQGRQSVQAVMIATVFAAFIVVGAVPFPKGSIDAVIPLVVIQLLVTAVLLYKAKYFMALIGLFFWPVAWVGAIRVARPNSRWARRRYANNPKKLIKARERGARWDRRRERFGDLIAGAPDDEIARKQELAREAEKAREQEEAGEKELAAAEAQPGGRAKEEPGSGGG